MYCTTMNSIKCLYLEECYKLQKFWNKSPDSDSIPCLTPQKTLHTLLTFNNCRLHDNKHSVNDLSYGLRKKQKERVLGIEIRQCSEYLTKCFKQDSNTHIEFRELINQRSYIS